MPQQQQVNYLLSQLEAAGKRSTPQRHAVCQVLIDHGGHPTVAEVYERVRAIFPMISQATVYNTIDTLEELGLLQQLGISHHEHAHYDLNQRPHVNIVCTHCHTISDVHTDTLHLLFEQISYNSGYTINPRATLLMYGVCPTCRAGDSS